MKKVLLFIVLLMPIISFAQYIDEKKAREIAASAFKESVVNTAMRSPAVNSQEQIKRVVPRLELHRVVKNDEGDLPCFYIYNQKSGDGGFAIVSNQGQLLGYSDHGAMNYDSIPDNLRWLLGQYQKVLSVRQRMPYPDDAEYGVGDVVEEPSLDRNKHSIDRLIGSAWHQHEPFSSKLQDWYDDSGATRKKGIVAGCNAIAMGQVMFKWQYPQRGNGTSSLILGEIEHTDNLGYYPIEWEKFGPTANDCDSVAIAILIYDLVASLNAKVSGEGWTESSNDDIRNALVNHFDYDPSATLKKREVFAKYEFEHLAYCELEQGRPCIIGGRSLNPHCRGSQCN